MILYENSKSGFIDDFVYNRIVDEIRAGFERQGVGARARPKSGAWHNSLQYMSNLLGESDVPDQSGVAIEFRIPLMSRRVDVMVSGYTPDA